jgi:hypothetical protein
LPERLERWLEKWTGRVVASDWFERVARFGYASKGVVFGMVGVLAVSRGLGAARGAEDTPGAVEALGALPFHEVLLGVLALGLAGYAAWRLVQALLDAEDEGTGLLGLTKRGVYLGIGVFYGYLAVFAAGVIMGMRSNDNGVEDFTATVLGWPAGQVLVGLAGLGVIAGGLNEVVYALRGRYRDEFQHGRMASWERVALAGAGWWGHVGRGAVYCVMGYLVVRAAVTFDPDDAAGLAKTFRELEGQPFGGWLLLAAGASFVAFGVYSALIAVRGTIGNEEAVSGGL